MKNASTYRAVQAVTKGKLELTDKPLLDPPAGHVRIRVEACGVCQPTDGTRLDCNMSMPISAGTASGAAQIDTYMCGAAMTTVSAPGKELPFYFRSPSDPTFPSHWTRCSGGWWPSMLRTDFRA